LTHYLYNIVQYLKGKKLLISIPGWMYQSSRLYLETSVSDRGRGSEDNCSTQ